MALGILWILCQQGSARMAHMQNEDLLCLHYEQNSIVLSFAHQKLSDFLLKLFGFWCKSAAVWEEFEGMNGREKVFIPMLCRCGVNMVCHPAKRRFNFTQGLGQDFDLVIHARGGCFSFSRSSSKAAIAGTALPSASSSSPR